MTYKDFGEWAVYYFVIGFISALFVIMVLIAINNTAKANESEMTGKVKLTPENCYTTCLSECKQQCR